MYGINSILYQRGIYAPETFTHTQKYGLTMLVTANNELKNYLNNILSDVKGKQLKALIGFYEVAKCDYIMSDGLQSMNLSLI